MQESVVLKSGTFYKCSVDKILHPTEIEERTRLDKSTDAWTMFRTYIREGAHYEPRLCVGMAPPLSVGDELILVGDWVDAGKYGLQFQFSGIQKQIPCERSGIVQFLTKNINGVGPATAEKIVDVLGLDVISKIKENESVLESINGISKIKAQKIKDQLAALEPSLDDLLFFSKTGLGTARTMAVKSTYENMSKDLGKKIDIIALIKKNPYTLVDDVKGVGFKVADSVAVNIGFPIDSPLRIKSGIEFTLKEELDTKGNLWTDKESLIKTASSKDFLNLSPIKIAPILDEMISSGKLIQEDCRVYLPYYHKLEFDISDKIKLMQEWQSLFFYENIGAGIEKAEIAKNRSLDDSQKAAVITCINNNVSIITGGPGVGKTTTLDILLHYLENECNMEITMAAPTGRAAKRMTEQTGRPSSTIHALCLRKTAEDFKFVEKRQVLVVDESSMIDTTVMDMVTKLCDVSTKLIFVGDVDQLPSIGPGQILKDLIDSGVIPTARLTKIHRQSADSHIISNAHLCIKGKHLEKEGTKDFFIAERESEIECLNSIKNYVTNVYPSKLGVSPQDVQVLAPLRRGLLGVSNLNKVLQEVINPPHQNKMEIELKTQNDVMIFREGDKVIQNKNDYSIPCVGGDKGVFNGEIGFIEEILKTNGEISVSVRFSDKEAWYDATSIKNLSLAYSVTIHKSQGSEFKVVILPLYNYGMPTIYNRNLLYTAITRAKSYCCIVGKRETVNKMIHNNKINKRRTTLAFRLSGREEACTKKNASRKSKKK